MIREIKTTLLFLGLAFIAGTAFAETIEFVTYYPAPSASSDDMHVNSLTVGAAYKGVNPTNGTAIISDKLGIGTNAPRGVLDVVGAVILGGLPDKVLFMPAVGGTLNVGIGTAAPSEAALEIKGITNAAGNVAAAVSQSTNNAANAPSLVLRRFRGTDAAPAVIQNNDLLGTLQFEGYDGVQRRTGAQISAEIDAAPGAGDLPTRLLFSTTADGAAAPAERMRITNAGNVGIGTNAPTQRLDVFGNARVSGNVQVDGALNGANGVFISNLFVGSTRTWSNGSSGVYVDVPDSVKTINLPAGRAVITYSLTGRTTSGIVPSGLFALWHVRVVVGPNASPGQVWAPSSKNYHYLQSGSWVTDVLGGDTTIKLQVQSFKNADEPNFTEFDQNEYDSVNWTIVVYRN